MRSPNATMRSAFASIAAFTRCLSSSRVMRARSTLRVLTHERLHALPGVGRRVLELGVLSVEETVRRAWVHDRLVLDVGLLADGVERVDVLLRNALVRAAD